jgi:glutamate carboxypeptidase
MNIEELLEKWVNQNSHFSNVPGIMTILENVANEAQGLGMLIDWHRAVYGKASALCATLPAVENGKAISPEHTILLVTHADTVFPIDSRFQTIRWNHDRSQAIGPGVIDDKGGILVSLLVAQHLSVLSDRNYEVKLLCMPSEECGSPGFSKWMEAQSKTATLILGFEPALPDGSIIHSRRGNRWYEFKLNGPGGHAGRDAGKVMNPASELSKLISKIVEIGIPTKGSSTTLGSFHTNTEGFNVIPSSALAKIDVRYETNGIRDQIHQQIESILKTFPHSSELEMHLAEDCPAMSLNPESIPVADLLIEAIQKIENRTITAVSGMGSSDSNYLYQPGIPMIDGLGPVGIGLHTENETLEVSTLKTRSLAIAEVIQKL